MASSPSLRDGNAIYKLKKKHNFPWTSFHYAPSYLLWIFELFIWLYFLYIYIFFYQLRYFIYAFFCCLSVNFCHFCNHDAILPLYQLILSTLHCLLNKPLIFHHKSFSLTHVLRALRGIYEVLLNNYIYII